MIEKVLLNWSGGKDSAMALYKLKNDSRYSLSGLLTTVTEEYDRISMHGVRRVLLEQQAESLEVPLEVVRITPRSQNAEYEAKIKNSLMEYKTQGIHSVAFGDIFLEDLKKYRQENLSKVGMDGIFPIWKRNTLELAEKFINLGFKAILTCVDSKVLNKSFAGREFDKKLVSELPDNIDPCGENGEFHSFVYDGPVFKNRVFFNKGKVVLRDKRFYFCDLIPGQP